MCHPLKLRSILLDSVILWPGWNRFPDWLSTREVTCRRSEKEVGSSSAASAEVSVTSNPLSDVRFLFILLDSLSLKDVAIKGDHMTIYVAKRKND